MKTFHITYIIQEEPFLTSGINLDVPHLGCLIMKFMHETGVDIDKIISIVDKSIFTFNANQNENTNKRTD